MLDQSLLQALGRLDARLLAACDEQEARARLLAGDGRAGWDGVRNLARPGAAELLDPDPQRVAIPGSDDPGALYRPGHPVLDRLARAGFDQVCCDVIIVALAAHIEVRYQSLFGFLQDDLQQHRATERVLTALLATTAPRRRALAAALAPGGPLLRSGLVVRLPGSHPPLGRPYDLAEDFVDILLGDSQPLVPGMLQQRWHDGQAQVGAHGLQVVHGAGDVLGTARQLTVTNTLALEGKVADGPVGAAACLAAWRIGLCLGAQVVLDLTSWPTDDLEPVLADLAARARTIGGACVVCTRAPVALEVPHVVASAPGWLQRKQAWIDQAARGDLHLSEQAAGRLASLFRLDAAEIAEVVRLAGEQATDDADHEELLRAVADGLHVTDVPHTVRITPRRTFDDLALNRNTRDALERLVHFVSRRDALAAEQGLDSRFPVDRGPLVLFSGRPGTGKSVAAEAVAEAIGRPLHTVDISQLLSKYIGDSEKHIHEVLTQAQQSAGVLLCDEADALFSTRKEQADSAGEQFANVLVGYLLQRIERHDGVVILSTNLRNAIDEAFGRRFQFRVEFPMPGPEERLAIWELMLVPGVPRARDLDLRRLADGHELSGGDITNAAMRAVFLADRAGVALGQEHLDEAIAIELLEQGRLARMDADPASATDQGALLRAVADRVAADLRAHLRRHFRKEIHVVHGSPTERALSGRRPAVSLALFRLAARRGTDGLRAGFITSAWSVLPEEEYELIGVVHELLTTIDLTEIRARPARLRVQESSDFDLLHKFWTSHDRPIRASVVFDVEID